MGSSPAALDAGMMPNTTPTRAKAWLLAGAEALLQQLLQEPCDRARLAEPRWTVDIRASHLGIVPTRTDFVEGIAKSYRGREVVRGVNCHLSVGEVVGLLGRQALAVQRDELAQRRQAALQLPAHLAVGAQQQNLQRLPSVYCVATQSR